MLVVSTSPIGDVSLQCVCCGYVPYRGCQSALLVVSTSPIGDVGTDSHQKTRPLCSFMYWGVCSKGETAQKRTHYDDDDDDDDDDD